MPVAWNHDEPRDLSTLERNLGQVLRLILERAPQREIPTVELAKSWHRQDWCAARYGLPPFIRLRPRPEGNAYALAAADSMRGDHRAMIAALVDLLEGYLDSRR